MTTCLLATIPAPPFQNLTVGPLTLHGYGLVIGIAIVVALAITERVFGWLGGPVDRVNGVAMVAILSGFVGARLYHVASEPTRYAQDPLEALRVWHGGLGIYGAVLFGLLGAWVACQAAGISIARFADAVAVALPLAQSIGRWGNYLNQELFGRPTSLPWGLEVDRPFRPYGALESCCFHPTFLYESLLNLLLSGLLLWWIRSTRNSGRRAPGTAFCAYLVGYSLLRLFVENMRIDPTNVAFGLRQNQWVSITLLVIAAAWWVALQVRWNRRTRKDEPAPEPLVEPNTHQEP